MTRPRPFNEDDAPGRIPESLIDSVLDGSVDNRTRREVARALRHDPRRRQDVAETVEAIAAMRGPLDCPDLSDSVLAQLDRRHRFLSPRVRGLVRRARMTSALGLLVALLAVAVVQRAMPRFASLGPQATPITDVARAVQNETAQAAGQVRTGVRDSVRVVQASLPSLSAGLTMPGRPAEMHAGLHPGDRGAEEAARIADAVASVPPRFRIVSLDAGRFFIVERVEPCRPASDARGGFVASLNTPAGPSHAGEDEPLAADPLP